MIRAGAASLALAVILASPLAMADRPPPRPARHVEASRGDAVIQMETLVTAYCQGAITATGTRARVGECAVDPRVIPLGSQVYVPGYGWAVAEDTGGAVKGPHIDVFMTDRSEALAWGERVVSVTVWPPGK